VANVFFRNTSHSFHRGLNAIFDRRWYNRAVGRKWKLREIDLHVQERRGDFSRVKYEMLKHTHTQADGLLETELNIGKELDAYG
jgi:polyphosphate kinase 2 (PPK2 family)